MLTMRNADNQKTMRAILARLYAINSYYAHLDYKRANPDGRRFDKKGRPLQHVPYALSPRTLEAREHYSLAQQAIWTDETENRIKAYQIRLRQSGELDKILAWEKENERRFKNNPWRSEEGENE